MAKLYALAGDMARRLARPLEELKKSGVAEKYGTAIKYSVAKIKNVATILQAAKVKDSDDQINNQHLSALKQIYQERSMEKAIQDTVRGCNNTSKELRMELTKLKDERKKLPEGSEKNDLKNKLLDLKYYIHVIDRARLLTKKLEKDAKFLDHELRGLLQNNKK